DGKWLMTWGGVDGFSRIWNLATGAENGSGVRHGYITRSAVFAPGGERFATASSDQTVIIWDRSTMQPVCGPLKQDGEVRSLCFDPSGERLFAGNWEKSVQVWDSTTGKAALPSLMHKGLSTYAALAVSPNGQWLASLSLENTVRIWDIPSGQLARNELRHSSAGNQMAFASEHAHLAVGCLDGTAYLWDLSREE